MGKRVISSEEFIDRFVECLEKGKDFELTDCIIKGIISIKDIYERIKDNKKLKKLISEDEKDENILKWIIKSITVNINIYIYNVEFNNDFKIYDERFIFETGKAERLQMVFNGNVDFIKSEFNRETNFKNSIFNKKVSYFECTFKRADFSNVLFNGYVSFYNSEFHRDVNFMQTKFFGYVNFHATKFNEFVGFIFSEFNGAIYFLQSEFNRVTFCSIFVGEIKFIYSKFREFADFTDSEFNGEVNFSNITANKIYFHNSTFKFRADFRDIRFNLISFVDSTFEDLALFRKGIKFEKYEKYGINLKKPNKQWTHTIINMIKDKCLAIFLNTQFLNKHTKIENFPLSKTSFLKTDVREVMILCDIKKEEILSHKLLKLKENAEGIYKEAYEILKNHLDYKSILAEYRNLRISIENNRTYIEASNLYTMEMELIKEFSDSRFERFIIRAYKEISDYGESIEKTGKWIFYSIIVFTILASMLRFKEMEWDIIEIIKFWFVSFLEVIRLFLQIGTDDKSLWILEPIVRVTSLILLGNLYIAVRRKLSRK
ncbi:conserved hypothetical protein [Methanocaldococcus sp. FS406-22]|uniref:pentapeptide repeat-containing protein n=1 Tax=Methanocaldococcus sp. (strain FS406-22) TaxID=644281 RepID=UPI0001BF34CA|nr:pentapeptide repeat-containing protein [Methanocaldococcus sp. FS406-22]ADC70459.1 conserved hypothetical protein [Methanocaldococcus sp. FS406-22]